MENNDRILRIFGDLEACTDPRFVRQTFEDLGLDYSQVANKDINYIRAVVAAKLRTLAVRPPVVRPKAVAPRKSTGNEMLLLANAPPSYFEQQQRQLAPQQLPQQLLPQAQQPQAQQPQPQQPQAQQPQPQQQQRSCALLPTMIDSQRKCDAIYNQLNDHQRQVFDVVHQMIYDSQSVVAHASKGTYRTENPFTLLLDSPPGVGKTTLITALAGTLRNSILFCVYLHTLRDIAAGVMNIDASTNCSFLMRSMNISFTTAKGLLCFDPLPRIMQIAIELVRNSVLPSNAPTRPILMVVDEYTVISPPQVLLFYMIARKQRINLMFVGDQDQQSAITKSRYHNQNNFQLARALSSRVLELSHQVRITDMSYKEKMDRIKSLMKSKTDNVATSFAAKYAIFSMLRDRFLTSENYQAMFFSQYHVRLKARIERTEKYLDQMNVRYERSYFKLRFPGPQPKTFRYVDLDKTSMRSHKFPMYLLLVPGWKYVLTADFKKIIVIFERIHDNYAFVLRADDPKTRIRLMPVRMTETLLHKEWLQHLRNVVTEELAAESEAAAVAESNGMDVGDDVSSIAGGVLVNYPLRNFIYTYHAVQGLTIAADTIELDLDATMLNSIYVGLTRVKEERQISRIHTQNFMDLILTLYAEMVHKDTTHYYRATCVKLQQALLEWIYRKRENELLRSIVIQRDFQLESGEVFAAAVDRSNNVSPYRPPSVAQPFRGARCSREAYLNQTKTQSEWTDLLSAACFFRDRWDAVVERAQPFTATEIYAALQAYIHEKQLPPLKHTYTEDELREMNQQSANIADGTGAGNRPTPAWVEEEVAIEQQMLREAIAEDRPTILKRSAPSAARLFDVIKKRREEDDDDGEGSSDSDDCDDKDRREWRRRAK